MTRPKDSPQPFSREQIEWLAERDAALDVRREGWVSRRLARFRNQALVGFVVLVAGTALSFSQTADTQTLRAGLINSCERVNVLRAQSNLSDSVSFNILSLSARRERSLARLGPNSATHLRSARGLEAEASKLRVTRPTDCRKAVDDPTNYQFPLAGPLGNPRTGHINPDVVGILRDSAELARSNTGG